MVYGLTALGDDAEAVVVKVSEAVCAALDEFHFPVEALGDGVGFTEAPHGGDGLCPRGEGSGEGLESWEDDPGIAMSWRKAAEGGASGVL